MAIGTRPLGGIAQVIGVDVVMVSRTYVCDARCDA